MDGSDLYRSFIEWNAKRGEDDLRLAHQVWDMTPWVVDMFDGSMVRDDRYRQMIMWCHKKWGDPAWWPSGRKGAWQRGGTTVNGWTWWGFDTKDKMNEFASAWPAPAEAST